MVSWIKVWWHCLMNTFTNLKGEDHRMVSWIGGVNSYPTSGHYCTCGYNKKR